MHSEPPQQARGIHRPNSARTGQSRRCPPSGVGPINEAFARLIAATVLLVARSPCPLSSSYRCPKLGATHLAEQSLGAVGAQVELAGEARRGSRRSERIAEHVGVCSLLARCQESKKICCSRKSLRFQPGRRLYWVGHWRLLLMGRKMARGGPSSVGVRLAQHSREAGRWADGEFPGFSGYANSERVGHVRHRLARRPGWVLGVCAARAGPTTRS